MGAPAFLARPVVRGVLRLAAVVLGFAAVTYFDVRRIKPQPYGFLAHARELKGAIWMVLPVFPFLVMGFSLVCLIIASVLEKIGLPAHLGEEFVLYGQFYAPFSAIYWIMKKDWLASERASSLLPVASSGRPDR